MLSLIRIKKEYFKRNFSIVKNLTVILFVSGILILLNSCIKEETPQLTVSALQQEIEYGASATITWASSNSIEVRVDGVKLSNVNGSFVTEPLIKTTTFVFTAAGTENTVSASITIVVKALVVEAYVYAAPSGVVKYNNPITTVYMTTKNVTDSVIVNGKTISVKDSIKFEFLNRDTILNFTFTGKNGEKVKVEKKVEVIPPTKIDLMVDLLCLGPFQPEKREAEVSPSVWSDRGMSDSEKGEIRTFYKDGTYEVYSTVKKEYVIIRSDARWNFLGETELFYGGAKADVVLLDNDKLVLGGYFQIYSTELNKWVNGLYARTIFKRTK